MKKHVLSLLFVLLTVCLIACNGNNAGGGKGGEQGDVMQFYVSGDTIEGSALTKMSEKYTEETGIDIEVVDVPYSDMVTRITNMLRAGDPPALARVTGFNPAWNGQLLDLTEIADANNIDKDLGIMVDDQLVAPPLDLTAVGMFINKDLFEEAGVAYPASEEEVWTWNEFLEGIETVLKNTDARYGLVMDNSEHRLNAFLYQHGSQGFYEEGEKYTTNPETMTALEKFVELNDNHIMPASVWTSGEDASSMFKSGLVPAYMSGSWQITDFATNITDFEWESVYLPYEEVRATNLGGNYLIGFEGSGQEDMAREFIDWLYQKENYEELATLGGYLPVVIDAEVDYEHAPEAYEIYNNEIVSSDPIASYQRAESVRKQLVSQRSVADTLDLEITKVLNNEQDLETAVERVKASMTNAYME